MKAIARVYWDPLRVKHSAERFVCFISSTPSNSPERLALIFPFNKARGGSFALHLGIGSAGFQTCFCLKTELEKLSPV